ncbi:MAG: ATP-binding cassette domain-containing protein, partial [Planctomycetota bacterium]
SLYTAWRNLAGASRRMFEILDTASEVADPADGPAGADAFEPSVALGVEVDDVAFAYRSSDARALAGVTLSVTPGSTVAFVGPSGSGKSTLFALLLRFYDPERGALRLDGRDVRTIALGELRRSIGFVPQDVFLLSGTIAENLRLGREGASETELWDALESAGAEAFVRALPQGVDTEVGERGLRLSGGQRQRIAIARAFLEDPALLLLDEATSALDPDSEERIQAALERLFHGRTTLVIAHRLSTARRADVIYVLDAGRIVDCGTHSTLIETSALYRRYWQLQSLDV